MPARETSALTSAQKKVLREASASVDKAFATARKTVAAAGIKRSDDEGSTRCLRPPDGHCEAFQPPKRGILCARPGCKHAFTKHDVF